MQAQMTEEPTGLQRLKDYWNTHFKPQPQVSSGLLSYLGFFSTLPVPEIDNDPTNEPDFIAQFIKLANNKLTQIKTEFNVLLKIELENKKLEFLSLIGFTESLIHAQLSDVESSINTKCDRLTTLKAKIEKYLPQLTLEVAKQKFIEQQSAIIGTNTQITDTPALIKQFYDKINKVNNPTHLDQLNGFILLTIHLHRLFPHETSIPSCNDILPESKANWLEAYDKATCKNDYLLNLIQVYQQTSIVSTVLSYIPGISYLYTLDIPPSLEQIAYLTAHYFNSFQEIPQNSALNSQLISEKALQYYCQNYVSQAFPSASELSSKALIDKVRNIIKSARKADPSLTDFIVISEEIDEDNLHTLLEKLLHCLRETSVAISNMTRSLTLIPQIENLSALSIQENAFAHAIKNPGIEDLKNNFPQNLQQYLNNAIELQELITLADDLNRQSLGHPVTVDKTRPRCVAVIEPAPAWGNPMNS
jgi:hypothetical protein